MIKRLQKLTLSTAILAGSSSVLSAGHPSQGLWVGEVTLNAVNEATGAVGDSNTYEFSDPEFTTATSDNAYLRLILHVNGAGQVSLLKSVAVVDGVNGSLLLTDPNLYASHTGIGKRIASAFYDFSDQKAVLAVEELIDASTDAAVAGAIAGKTLSAIGTDTQNAVDDVVGEADVDKAYLDRGTGASSFITDHYFSLTEAQQIADEVARLIHTATKTSADIPADETVTNFFPADPLGGNFAAVVATARNLRDASSFYGDPRPVEAIVQLVKSAAAAVDDAPDGADLAAKQELARNAAEDARHNAADVTEAYNRFIAGDTFATVQAELSDLVVEAALIAHARGGDEAQIASEVRASLIAADAIAPAYTEATTLLSESLWGDGRSGDALDLLVDAAANSSAAQVILSQEIILLKEVVDDAIVSAAELVEFAPVFAAAPSSDYTGFVTASEYSAAANTAAQEAASEAHFQYNAGVTDQDDLSYLTNLAVKKALLDIRNTAAALPQDTISLDGDLLPSSVLSGTIHLPALAPTNPFMHRRHPDHTEGYDIQRALTLTVASSDESTFSSAGYGVSVITGTYEEEIFGLHKLLGPNQDVGLKTAGSFILNRISFVDSLNY